MKGQLGFSSGESILATGHIVNSDQYQFWCPASTWHKISFCNLTSVGYSHLFMLCRKVFVIAFNNTITDGGVAPRCSFAGPT